MSLQGSLDGFPLPDVLALLASTKKQGELRVAGHQGAGRVWLADGAVVGVEAGSVRAPVDALFQLLRVDSGSFTFDPSAEVPPGKPSDLEPLLTDAQARLVEWRGIEAVVPSLATRVTLADELPAAKVTVSAVQWKVLRTVAVSGTVGDVGAALDVDEFHACQAVKRLVDAGLVLVGEGADGAKAAHVKASEPEAAEQESAPDDGVQEEREDESEASADDGLVTIPEHLRGRRAKPEPAPEPVAAGRRDPMAVAAARRRRELLGGEASEEATGTAVAMTVENTSDLMRELADLGADSEGAGDAKALEERASALEGVLSNEQGEPLNRSTLLKFLSSVRT